MIADSARVLKMRLAGLARKRSAVSLVTILEKTGGDNKGLTRRTGAPGL